MKKINQYIQEKFLIDDDISIIDQYMEVKITSQLCKYFSSSGSYKNRHYKTRFEIVQKLFNKQIWKYFDKYNLWEDITLYIDVNLDEEDFKYYIKNNNTELYKLIENYLKNKRML